MATKEPKSEVDLGGLSRLNLARLQLLHRDLFGEESRVKNAGHLRRKLAWQMQAREHGGLPESAGQHALEIARDAALRVRIGENLSRRRSGIALDCAATTVVAPEHDARLPMAGTLLWKDYKNRTIVVKVLDHGFEYDRRRFTSLSAIAQEITGTKWNGYRFFGLAKENRIAR